MSRFYILYLSANWQLFHLSKPQQNISLGFRDGFLAGMHMFTPFVETCEGWVCGSAVKNKRLGHMICCRGCLHPDWFSLYRGFHLTSSFRLRSCLFTSDSTLKTSRMAFLFYFNLIQCTFISVVGELTAGFVLPSIYICLLSLAYKQRCVPQGFMNSPKEELYLSPSHLSLCERTE